MLLDDSEKFLVINHFFPFFWDIGLSFFLLSGHFLLVGFVDHGFLQLDGGRSENVSGFG